jgi:PAS domain-containing protein
MASIAIDIDDSLYSFTDEAREQLFLMIEEPKYATRAEQLKRCVYAKWDQWRTPYELCGFDEDGNSLWLKCIQRCHDDHAIFRQEPFRNSVEVLRELVDNGHNLVYISNRHTETEYATQRWLNKNGFPEGKLVITSGDKLPHIRHCQYMVDDRPKNVIEFAYDFEWMAGAGRHQGERVAFVRVADYNGGLTDVPRLYLAHTWRGLRSYMVKEGLIPEYSYA